MLINVMLINKKTCSVLMRPLDLRLEVYAPLPMSVGSGGHGAEPLWIFIHSTDIVDRGLIVLFSVFFAIFRSFSVAPPGNFSADALALVMPLSIIHAGFTI